MYQELLPQVKEGITTGDLDGIAKNLIRKRRGRPAFLGYDGYPGALCTSVNHQVIHGIPGKYRLREGDIIGLDLGIEFKGFFSDRAITVPVGKISRAAEALIKVAKECLRLGIDAARVGNRIKDISRAIFQHATDHNCGVVREFCGHGVGLAIHEEPQVHNFVAPGPNPRIRAGMVLAIEPMINAGGGGIRILSDGWTVETKDRSLSAHFEHTVAILPEKTEILTVLD